MKTTFAYDHYFGYAELTDVLNTLTSAHSDIMSVESIGVTPKGRNVYAVTLSCGDPTNKPAFYVDGNTHAGEVTGSMAAIHTIDYLATNFGTNEEVTSLLTKYAFYVIPRISPDGAEAYLTSTARLRSVDRPYLSEEQQAGLYADDIDNDGSIRMMRVKTPYGAWKKSDKNPNIMVLRAPDDVEGEFYNVYTEGQIKDFDGLNIQNAPTLWGLDFNRNYPFGWYSEVRQPGAGPYPLSNMETKAVVDFVLAHQNIGCVLTHHTSGGIILYPPGTKPAKTLPALDMKILTTLAKMGKEETGYPVVPIFDDFMTDQVNYSSGAFDDWCFQQQGIPAYTIELWNMSKAAGVETSWPPKPQSEEKKVEDYEKMIAWISENNPEAFKPWTVCQHPQLGEVEVGGIDTKFTNQNPPKQLLLNEIANVTKMTLRMAKALPMLTFECVNSEKVGENTYKVEAVVANKGYLPTYLSKQTKAMKIEDEVKVNATSTATIINNSEVVLGSIEGFSGITTMFARGGYMTRNHDPLMKKVTYYVTGNAGDTVTITAGCVKTGKISTTVTL